MASLRENNMWLRRVFLAGFLIQSVPVRGADTCYGEEEFAYKAIIEHIPVTVDRRGNLSYGKNGQNVCSLNSDIADAGRKCRRCPPQARSIHGDEILGTWRNQEKLAKLRFALSSGHVKIDGDTSYTNSSGSTSVGMFIGSSSIADVTSGNKIFFDQGDAVHRPGDDQCFLRIKSLGHFLLVVDSDRMDGLCGGSGVTFTGVYNKVP